MSFNILKNNISAIKLAIELENENRNPTENEKLILNQFKGWGGIKAVHYPVDKDWASISAISHVDRSLEVPVKELYSLLKESFPNEYSKIWESIKLATLTSFYTPDFVVDAIIRKQAEANPNIESFLEPSAGMGIYIDKVLQYFPNIKKISAVEKDFLTSFILKQKYRGDDKIEVISKGFEEIKFSEKFDFIASNIPFGDIAVLDKHTNYPSEVSSKIHNFFAYHSSELLKEGGQMALISSTGLMNSKSNREVRKLIGDNCVYNSLITLPKNSFKDAKTEVSSHLIIATKSSIRSEVENENNKTFIENYTHENGIIENEYLALNSYTGFLGQDFEVDTNPYGQLEHNYKIADQETFNEALDKFISFPKTQIVSEKEKSVKIEYDYYPSIQLSDVKNQDQSKYLDQFVRFENVQEFEGKEVYNIRIVGAIKGNYKGKTIPIATILRGDLKNTKKGAYAIDVYLKNENISIPSEGWQNAGVFKQEFARLVGEIEKLSEENLIEITTDVPRTGDGENFQQYWADKFHQPELSQVYRLDLGKYQFYTPPKEKDYFIDIYGAIQKINKVEEIEGENLYLLEKAKLPPTEQDKLYSLLMINHHYNSFLNFEKKVKDLKNTQIIADKEDAIISRFDKIISNLNQDYDDFVKKYGSINDNKEFLKKYIPSYSSFLTSLEVIERVSSTGTDLFSFEQEKARKSDIFNFQFVLDEKVLEKVISPAEALVKSINTKGNVDLEYIAKLTEIEDENQLLEELKDRISYNPITNEYELKEIFLSGDIYKKIDIINENNTISNEDKEFAINELLTVLPEKVSYHQITKQVGSRWIPTEILNHFFDEFYNSRFDINYNQNTDNFNVVVKFRGQGYSEYKCISNRYIRAEDIITNAFYDTYPVVKYTVEIDGEKVTYIDEKATRYYKTEIDKVKVSFQNYLNSLSDTEKQRLEEIYNRNFNAIALPNIDGSILNFEDMNLGNMNIKDIYPHQKDAVWKTIINQGGVVDHEVGFGKTLTMCALAHKMKSLKIVNKPLILGLPANVKELANTYSKLFPDANILFANPKDYSAKNRAEFINKIKTNNWDVVIMSHHQFGRIPQNEQIEINLIEQELEEVTDNLYEISQNNPTKKQLLGLKKTQENLNKKLATLKESINNRKDKNILSFDDLGIDHIIIDESHFFKNLPFVTKHNQVSGLGSANKMDEGKKNRNLLTALRSIQRNTPTGDFGATFFSGTPISNSLTELYLIQKYLTPNLLKEKGIYNFDSWASNFAMKSVEFEANMVNEIVAKERFRYFINLPELGKSYNYISHIMNGRINPTMVDRPELEEKLILSEQTALQRKFNVRLSRFINTGDVSLLNIEKKLKEGENIEKARSLVAMNLAFDASIDMRMINSKFPDEAGSKINTMVEDVLKTYRKFDGQKGTQIIFSDRGKTDKKLSFEELEENYQNNVFTSIYEDIKYKLIKSGVPENEIAFIHHWDDKKEELSRKMNAGEIRILIGSTEKSGTGLNVQSKLVSVKHLTIPWKPSEFEQRNGRGYRKGNIIAKEYNNNKFESGIMGTQNTLDSYKIDLNKNKAKFIDQIRSASNNNVRIADEGEVDENTGMNLAELQAQLMGDNTLLEKTKIDKKIKELEQEKSFIAGEVYSANYEIRKATERIEELSVILDYCKKDLETANAQIQYDEKTKTRINKPNYVNLSPDASAEEIKKYFSELNVKIRDNEKDYSHKIGEMYGFTLYAQNTFWEGVKFYMTRTDGDGKTKYEYNGGRPNFETDNGAKNYFINCFNSIAKRVENNERLINSLKSDIVRYELKKDLKFEKDDLLDEYREQRDNLEEKLKNRKEQDEFEVKTALNYNGVESSFIVFRDLETLDKGFLLDKVGMDNSNGSAFLSKECLEVLERVASKGNLDLYGKIEDKESNLFLVTFHLRDSFLLYSDLDSEIQILRKQKQEQSQEINNGIEKPKNRGLKR